MPLPHTGRVQVAEHVGSVPEPEPESHASPVSTTPSPHDARRHVVRQASATVSLLAAPASHSSFASGMPLPMPGLVLENGSGLSRRERLTARGLARLLAAADASAVREEFSSSLAVAAIDGTVARRFQDGSVAGQALLKTGSLEGVRALAGYVIDASGNRFVIVAIVNHPNAARAQPALDNLAQWVYRNGAAYAH